MHGRAKSLLNSDNGGNESDSLEIAEETTPEISIRNFLGASFTGSEPEMTINGHVGSTLSTRRSYRINDAKLPRLSFETFGTSVPKLSTSVKTVRN